MSRQENPRTGSSSASELPEKMLRVLSSQRSLGCRAYPLTLQRLGQLTDATASATQVIQASQSRDFEIAAITARRSDISAPVALLDDISLLAESSLTLHYAFSLLDKNKTKAYTVAELKRKLTGRAKNALKGKFQQAIKQQMVDDSLPHDVGFVVAGNGRPRLFRLKDLQPAMWQKAIRESNAESHLDSGASPAMFPDLFEFAFSQLDRDLGGHNFVSLDALRSALSRFSREEFDAQLRELRIAKRYQLSGAENRTDLSPQQRAAGIREAGSLLLYAQRISR